MTASVAMERITVASTPASTAPMLRSQRVGGGVSLMAGLLPLLSSLGHRDQAARSVEDADHDTLAVGGPNGDIQISLRRRGTVYHWCRSSVAAAEVSVRIPSRATTHAERQVSKDAYDGSQCLGRG